MKSPEPERVDSFEGGIPEVCTRTGADIPPRGVPETVTTGVGFPVLLPFNNSTRAIPITMIAITAIIK
jgi:hypothetical protein